MITGKGPTKRQEFYYFTETVLHGLRYGDWKILFKDQDRWFNGVQENFVTPLITNLKLDRSNGSCKGTGDSDEWQENHAWLYGPANVQVARFLNAFSDFPRRAESLYFNIDDMMEALNPVRSR